MRFQLLSHRRQYFLQAWSDESALAPGKTLTSSSIVKIWDWLEWKGILLVTQVVQEDHLYGGNPMRHALRRRWSREGCFGFCRSYLLSIVNKWNIINNYQITVPAYALLQLIHFGVRASLISIYIRTCKPQITPYGLRLSIVRITEFFPGWLQLVPADCLNKLQKPQFRADISQT
jgi:hypothetical protein